MLTDFRETAGWDGNGNMTRETPISCLPRTRFLTGTEPATQARVPTGNETCHLSVYGDDAQPLSRPTQGCTCIP